jgi:hypothetical protein
LGDVRYERKENRAVNIGRVGQRLCRARKHSCELSPRGSSEHFSLKSIELRTSTTLDENAGLPEIFQHRIEIRMFPLLDFGWQETALLGADIELECGTKP